MSLLDKLGKMLNPRKQVEALVDTVVLRLNDKYKIRLHVDAEIEIVDVKPESTVKLPGDTG